MSDKAYQILGSFTFKKHSNKEGFLTPFDLENCLNKLDTKHCIKKWFHASSIPDENYVKDIQVPLPSYRFFLTSWVLLTSIFLVTAEKKHSVQKALSKYGIWSPWTRIQHVSLNSRRWKSSENMFFHDGNTRRNK